jgi:UDP-N-acetylglucosamine 2-epimerase
MRILSVFGTRPEAIKMAPVVHALSADPDVDSLVCVTAQHRGMLDQVLDVFDLTPNADLDLMTHGQTLHELTGRIVVGLKDVYDTMQPDRVLVHGDTTTTMGASLAAYYAQIPVGHVEAGLRTGDIYSPWPEEVNRRITSVITDLHFAPTERARQNLLNEAVPSNSIVVTGNTVIDALLNVTERLSTCREFQEAAAAQLPESTSGETVILVTGHRRENFGDGFRNICTAIRHVADTEEVRFVYPVHLNPNVSGPVEELLGDHPRINLMAPLEYVPFIEMMRRSDIVLTDSGGVQEEAPALGKPVLIMRDTSERPEAIDAGCARIVGTSAERIIEELTRLVKSKDLRADMVIGGSPYGDGHSSERIVQAIRSAHAMSIDPQIVS